MKKIFYSFLLLLLFQLPSTSLSAKNDVACIVEHVDASSVVHSTYDMMSRVIGLVSHYSGVEPYLITLSSSFYGDLGMDWLAMFELVIACEREFDIEIPDIDMDSFATVGDLYNIY